MIRENGKKLLSSFIVFLVAAAILAGLLLTLPNPAYADEGGARREILLNDGWLHQTEIFEDEAAQTTYPAAELLKWKKVNLPHTWNTTDGRDGGGNYLRTVGWYRKTIAYDKEANRGKRAYLEFLGSSIVTTVYVNGKAVGEPHKGGYTAFRYDVTDALKDGENLIAVKVDNRYDDTVAPLSADFNFYGGIHRDVKLLITDDLHVDTEDFASSGLYLTTENVSAESATIRCTAKIVNDGGVSRTAAIAVKLYEPATFTEVATVEVPRFDVDEMASGDGTPIDTATETNFTVAAGESKDFEAVFTVRDPKLWNGMKSPFRYLVRLEISDGAAEIDSVEQYVGLRFFEAKLEGDPETDGFYLNGEKYPLRGVNRHQDWSDMAFALTKKEHDIDFGMIYEIGANAVRLAHYPQDPYFYDLCDRYGLVVWAEIPLVDKISDDENFEEFEAVTLNMLEELIKQQYNRPSIMFWGLQNELNNGGRLNTPHAKENAKKLMRELNQKAHSLDKTRYTTQATNSDVAYDWESDLIAWNNYPGWYGTGSLGALLENQNYNVCTDPDCTDRKHCSDPTHKRRPVGISEYGSGGNVDQHGYGIVRNDGQYHPEEYQTENQRENILSIMTAPYAWCTFVWNMFEFSSDWRNEGDNPGINDKGLVTYDRSVKKDAFYVYKAWWNQDETTLHIDSRRYKKQTAGKVSVTVSSNCDEVELFLTNDKNKRVSLGKLNKSDADAGIFFEWKGVKLLKGYNKIEAVGIDFDTNGNIASYTYDEVIWRTEPNLPLILGLSLGLGIPALLAAIGVPLFFVIRKKRKKKAAAQQDEATEEIAVSETSSKQSETETIGNSTDRTEE